MLTVNVDYRLHIHSLEVKCVASITKHMFIRYNCKLHAVVAMQVYASHKAILYPLSCMYLVCLISQKRCLFLYIPGRYKSNELHGSIQ